MRQRRGEPGKLKAGALALLVHAAFFVLLVFGVTWRTRQPPGVEVDLWSSVPAPSKAQPEPAPKPPEPKPPPEPEPKPETKAEPKAEPKPDIALKEKEEKLKKEREEKARLEEEKRKKEEERKKKEEQAKQQKLEQEKAQKLAEQKAKAAKDAADKAARAASDAKIDDYVSRIRAKIKSNTVIPPDLVGNPEVVYRVTLLPTGEILDIRLEKSSGFPSYDEATERAIRKSSPLPVPSDDPALFQSRFRVGDYKFRPND